MLGDMWFPLQGKSVSGEVHVVILLDLMNRQVCFCFCGCCHFSNPIQRVYIPHALLNNSNFSFLNTVSEEILLQMELLCENLENNSKTEGNFFTFLVMQFRVDFIYHLQRKSISKFQIQPNLRHLFPPTHPSLR